MALRAHTSKLTSKGQVTIPLAVRRLLRLSPRDRVAFVVDDGQVRLARAESVVARTAGAIRASGAAVPAEELRGAAEEAIAGETVERTDG